MSKENLREIKKGEFGTGLLIENDGYISISNSEHNKKLYESMSGGQWNVPNPFIVDAVFQKYDIKNANGRIYPERTLKKQVELYQQKIAEHRAYGECYKPDALILAEDGWKTLEEIKVGDRILTLNVDTKEIEIKAIDEKIEYDYDGEMINIHSRNINDVVTPDHSYVVYDDHNDKYIGRYTAQEIFDRKTKRHAYIPKQGKWIGKNDEFFTIPNLPKERIEKMQKNHREKYSSDMKIPMSIFAKFMGIYLSEGACDKKEDGDRVFIYQRKEKTTKEIKEMLDEWGIEYKIEERISEDNKKTTVFSLFDMRLCKYLQQFGTCYDKFVPFELKQQNSEILRSFYDWFVKGDGRMKDYNKKYSITDDVFSTSKRLALDLNEIQLKIGYSGNYHMEMRDNDRFIEDRLIEGKNCHPMHFSFRSLTKGIRLDNRFIKADKIPYKGKVICVKVPNHTFYVMCNDKSHWTSNYCNHPSDSVIDLGRISHNIIELHWEGRTLVGKLELNVSEGFRRNGICSTLGDTVAQLILQGYKIGVSSRGLGSVEQKLGQTIVGDDFELICWDIVSDPSTPGAYIGHGEDLQQYVESKDNVSTNSRLNEQLKKIENILAS